MFPEFLVILKRGRESTNRLCDILAQISGIFVKTTQKAVDF